MKAIFFLFYTQFCFAYHMVILGDSLTEGYGVNKHKAYPALLAEKLKTELQEIKITASAVSGSLSSSGPSRLKWILKQNVDLVVIELGANDILRGLPAEQLEQNLLKMVEILADKNVSALVTEMKTPPNYGEAKQQNYAAVYSRLQKQGVQIIPFMLEGVAGEKKYNLDDGIHPNEQGHQKIAENLYQYFKKYFQSKGLL